MFLFLYLSSVCSLNHVKLQAAEDSLYQFENISACILSLALLKATCVNLVST